MYYEEYNGEQLLKYLSWHLFLIYIVQIPRF